MVTMADTSQAGHLALAILTSQSGAPSECPSRKVTRQRGVPGAPEARGPGWWREAALASRQAKAGTGTVANKLMLVLSLEN